LDENPVTNEKISEGIEQLIRDQLAFQLKYENYLGKIK
jgi:hypothetical protein